MCCFPPHRLSGQKPERLAPCPKSPASCKLQVPFGLRRISPPISPGTEPITNGRLVVFLEARLGRDPLSLTATLVINSLCCHQLEGLTTSRADGDPAGQQEATPGVSAPHREHTVGGSEATTLGVPHSPDWTSCGYTSGLNPNVLHD